jgi:ferredoxin
MRLAIAVDPDLCEGNAVCVRVAPAVFELCDDVDQVRLRADHADGELADRVRKAARGCPRQAITLAEEA